MTFFMIRFHSLQGWTASARYEITRKKGEKNENDIGRLFRKNPRIKDVY